ncbi:uncharacterized protein LOC118749304 [Rhagoletis pomonella]|uniref:uncharacterized protein LOC118749304 n=1 Tax=Rhagoletis pomonella TaxID=28610 RepID=UPI0017851CD4|nr:uncharacterized protein LOC118749304 [Rhagoletis pomonella]
MKLLVGKSEIATKLSNKICLLKIAYCQCYLLFIVTLKISMNGNPVFIASKGNNDKRKSERKMLNAKNLAFARLSSIEFNKQAKRLVMDKYIYKASKPSEVSVDNNNDDLFR